jgi:hypothetical protein
MKEGYDREDDRNDSRENPGSGSAGKTAKTQSEQHSANEDDSSYVPILSADFIEDFRSAFQPRDLFLQLLQTSHARVTITRLPLRSQKRLFFCE